MREYGCDMAKPTKKLTLDDVAAEVGRYPVEAYAFLSDGLGYTVQKLHSNAEQLPEKERHVSGKQLSEGLRDLAIERFGVLAPAVLRNWGIESTMDFGRMVFALVERGLLSKTESDSIEDFRDAFDFAEAFEPPARPSSSPAEPIFTI